MTSSLGLRSGVTLGFIASGAIALTVLAGLGGWAYYTTPLAVRGYAGGHPMLRPSGPWGQSFGLIGAALMLVPFLYMLRKKLGRGPGRLKTWLEVHLFCGIVGPVLITFHSSFKFNGIVSAAYWSMVIVMLSGFVGRYLYVRIPRSLRGIELTRAELDQQAAALHEEIVARPGAAGLIGAIEALERLAVPQRPTWVGLLFGEIGLRGRLRRFSQQLRFNRLPEDQERALVRLTTERVLLLRQVAYLQWTRRAFDLWHVFHLPLVYLLLVIVAVHVSLTVYMGYVPFRW
jgi:hypothetical protein